MKIKTEESRAKSQAPEVQSSTWSSGCPVGNKRSVKRERIRGRCCQRREGARDEEDPRGGEEEEEEEVEVEVEAEVWWQNERVCREEGNSGCKSDSAEAKGKGKEAAAEVSEMKPLGRIRTRRRRRGGGGGTDVIEANDSQQSLPMGSHLRRQFLAGKQVIIPKMLALLFLAGATCYLVQGEQVSRFGGAGDHEARRDAAGPEREGALARPASAIKNISAQNGQSVLLHCLVDPSADSASVSWFRGAGEPQLLTYESTTIIPDERFVVRHNLMKDNDWALQIKNLDKSSDSGLYQCQTNSDPPHSQYYQLNVLEPQVNILGAPDLAVKLNAAINLTCVISQAPDQLQYVFWYRDQRMINFDITGERGKIVMSKWPQKADTMISNLQIFNSRLADSGNYTCMPANGRPMSIHVHVLEASSQQTNSAFSVHVVRLSRGRAYALFAAFLIFATWWQLVLHLQTAITILLLAIIGYLLGKINDGQETSAAAPSSLVLAAASESGTKSYQQDGLLKSLVDSVETETLINGSTQKRRKCAGKRLNDPALTSPSGHSTGSNSSSSASTGYNSDTRSTTLGTSPSVQVTTSTGLPVQQVAKVSNSGSNQEEEEEEIELVSQPTALRLIMDEFSSPRATPLRQVTPDGEPYYSAPARAATHSQLIPSLPEATPTECSAASSPALRNEER